MLVNELIVKDNALINASYNLDTVEQRLVLLAILQARESNIDIDAYTKLRVYAGDYMNKFNVDKHAAYKALKNAVNNLFGRQFSYMTFDEKTGKSKKVISRWVQSIAYIEDAATLELAFTIEVIPLITRLEQQFTSYQLKQVSQLTSKYAIRLYEILIAWREVGKTPIINVADLRSKLGLGDSDYPRMDTFKRRVLDAAMSQINESTDIRVTYDQYKQGKTIAGFAFKLKQKEKLKKIEEINRDQNTIDMFYEMTDAQIHTFGNQLSKLHELSHLAVVGESYE
ncbi:replication initiation protein RepM, partial [Acinetobacter stercoris]|uniref:replication initiation protein RepM n=1 Tax=Acinetobacter stercoris TaxID=2126983 RepID=UPI0011B219F5